MGFFILWARMSKIGTLNRKTVLVNPSKYIFVVKSGLKSVTRPLSSEEIAFLYCPR